MRNFVVYGLVGFVGYYVIIDIGSAAAENFHLKSHVLAPLEQLFKSEILSKYGGIATGFLTGCLKLVWKESMKEARQTERKIDRLMSGTRGRGRRSYR